MITTENTNKNIAYMNNVSCIIVEFIFYVPQLCEVWGSNPTSALGEDHMFFTCQTPQ